MKHALTRRRLLAGLCGGAAALAGCAGGGGGGSGGVPVGEPRTYRKLRWTVTNVVSRPHLALVAGRETRVRNRTVTAGAETVTATSPEEERYVVVVLRVENRTDETQELVTVNASNPGQGQLFITGGVRRFHPVNGRLPDGLDLLVGGTAIEPLEDVSAAHRWSLPPGESMRGWLAFLLAAESPVSGASLVVRKEGLRAKFQLALD